MQHTSITLIQVGVLNNVVLLSMLFTIQRKPSSSVSKSIILVTTVRVATSSIVLGEASQEFQ